MDKAELLKELRIDRSKAPPPSRKPLWLALLVVVLALGGGGAWLVLAGPSALPVRTALAQPMQTNRSGVSVLDATGYVTARREAAVSAQITGTLSQVLIEEGDHVASGQVLARLEDASHRAAVAQAQAQLHVTESLLTQYQAQLAQNKRDLSRAEDLVARKLASQQSVEQARTQVETQSAQVATQQNQIELAQAAVQAAQIELDYCTVRAPFAGVVIAKSAQVGEIVSPLSAGGGFTRTGIGTIVDMDSLEVEVDVNEAYINRVVAGRPVESVLNAYPDWKIPSHVIAIIPTADRSKATVKVRIGLDTKDSRMVPDMGVRVSFLEAEPATKAATPAPQGVLVPTAALHKDGAQDIVFILKDGKAERRAVTLGGSVGELRQVLSGLRVGEVVITEAPAELKDGAAAVVKS